MGGHSEVTLHASGMPKIVDAGEVGVFLGVVITELFHCIVRQARYLQNRDVPFSKNPSMVTERQWNWFATGTSCKTVEI